jgi:hypothetical protein
VTQVRALALGKRREDIFDIRLGRKKHVAVGGAKPLSTQADLGDRFFARDIDHPMLPAGKCRGRLHQYGRLADARISADEQCGSANEAAAGHAIEFRNAGVDARRVFDLSGQRGKCDGTPLLRRAHGTAADPPRRVILDDRVPLAATVALAHPAGMDSAAILADELGAGFRHGCRLRMFAGGWRNCRRPRITLGGHIMPRIPD